MRSNLTFLSKSKWHPAIRREHALAKEAISEGFSVRFIEAPSDVRSIRRAPNEWRVRIGGVTINYEKISVTERSTIAPGHKNQLFKTVDNTLLSRRVLPSLLHDPIVTYLPWQWSASKKGQRRVFDCTDPWPRLYPHRESVIRRQLERVADEADEIVVVAHELSEFFPNRLVHVVPNGVDRQLLTESPMNLAGNSVMLYLGTLSERINFQLICDVLTALPSWSLDLVGPCAFRGLGDQPNQELRDLLNRFNDRVTLYGPVTRIEAQRFIDNSDVLIAPTFKQFAVGQSSMKTFDAAARGRHVLSTTGLSTGVEKAPPLLVADGVDEWVHALRSRAFESLTVEEIRLWAEEQTWDQRFRDWISLVVAK